VTGARRRRRCRTLSNRCRPSWLSSRRSSRAARGSSCPTDPGRPSSRLRLRFRCRSPLRLFESPRLRPCASPRLLPPSISPHVSLRRVSRRRPSRPLYLRLPSRLPFTPLRLPLPPYPRCLGDDFDLQSRSCSCSRSRASSSSARFCRAETHPRSGRLSPRRRRCSLLRRPPSRTRQPASDASSRHRRCGGRGSAPRRRRGALSSRRSRPTDSAGSTGGARPPSRAGIASLRAPPAPRRATLARTRSRLPTRGRAAVRMHSRGSRRRRSSPVRREPPSRCRACRWSRPCGRSRHTSPAPPHPRTTGPQRFGRTVSGSSRLG